MRKPSTLGRYLHLHVKSVVAAKDRLLLNRGYHLSRCDCKALFFLILGLRIFFKILRSEEGKK